MKDVPYNNGTQSYRSFLPQAPRYSWLCWTTCHIGWDSSVPV